jgi:hypothetical protein
MCEDEVKQNLALSQCTEFLQYPKGMITTPDNAKIPKATIDGGVAAILTYIQAQLLNGINTRWFFWPEFDSTEPIHKEAAYEDTVLSFQPTDEGAYRWRFFISQGMCLHKRMFTHRAKSGRVFIIDKQGKAQGTVFSNGDVAGMKVQLLNTEKIRLTDGGSVSTASPIVVALRDNLEIDRSGVLINVNTSELYRIADVTLKQVGVTLAGSIVVDIKTACDSLPVSGFVAADFLLIDDDNGVVHAIATAPEDANIPGRYNLTGAAFEASKLSLKAASLLSIKAYESDVIAIAAP